MHEVSAKSLFFNHIFLLTLYGIYMPGMYKFLLLLFVSQIAIGAPMFCSVQDTMTISHKQDSLRTHSATLDTYYSEKPLGAIVADGKTTFRLFAPQAAKVELCLFRKPEDTTHEEFTLVKDADGVWETTMRGEKSGMFYGYKVLHNSTENIERQPLCLDPYAKAVATYNTYLSPRKGLILKPNSYDWQGDTWIKRDWRDVVIYEMHVRDMTAHPSAGAKLPGTYYALSEKGIKGGINYIKSLDVNTVELLPSMEFANIELPYKHESIPGRVNTWNPYERNHWGYMTAAFFAPAAYYAEEWKELQWKKWQGKSGRQVNAFKDMVKAFHKNSMAVIMDVVYNHLSEYEMGNLKEIDKDYYFRTDENGKPTDWSYCGNDLKTERPMVRRLIIESILYWMKEYHVDGFRFDLGKMLDWITIEDIIHEAQKINPEVIFVCEPWGGGYDPAGFSLRGWGSWNDQIRNGVKGENPENALGWIFGKWQGNNSVKRLQSYVRGTLTRDSLGLFKKKEHAVNYLESHDGYTLGDFIRIGTGDVDPNTRITDVSKFVKLSAKQMQLNKLGALFLFTSQGMTMIQEGQEFARTKVIPRNNDAADTNKGRIDHNTYDKDNDANYLNFKHAEINNELVEYYKGLIQLRKKYAAFRRAEYEEIEFIKGLKNEFALGYSVSHAGETFLVLMNADQTKPEIFKLPEGEWDILVSPEKAGTVTLKTAEKELSAPAVSGYVLKRQK
jgi:pullulanase/glycogen debranching enzyme